RLGVVRIGRQDACLDQGQWALVGGWPGLPGDIGRALADGEHAVVPAAPGKPAAGEGAQSRQARCQQAAACYLEFHGSWSRLVAGEVESADGGGSCTAASMCCAVLNSCVQPASDCRSRPLKTDR